MAKDYSKMFDTPEDRAKERQARMAYYRETVIIVSKTQMTVVHGGDQVRTPTRQMKHKSFLVQGRHVK